MLSESGVGSVPVVGEFSNSSLREEPDISSILRLLRARTGVVWPEDSLFSHAELTYY